MRILVIGAVGQTARHVLWSLLDQGHDVTTLARGDVRDALCLERAIQNQDVVISCVTLTSIQDAMMRNLDAAMAKFGVKRLVNLLT
jgi:uncharacterized protein YbjT (DUF2867 family)